MMVTVPLRHDYASHFKFLLIKILLHHHHLFSRTKNLLLFISWLKYSFCPELKQLQLVVSQPITYTRWSPNICSIPISISSKDCMPVTWLSLRYESSVLPVRITTVGEQKTRRVIFRRHTEDWKGELLCLLLVITVGSLCYFRHAI